MKLKIHAILLSSVSGIFQAGDGPLNGLGEGPDGPNRPDQKSSLSKEYNYFDYDYWGQYYDYNYHYDHENLLQKGTCTGLYHHKTTCPVGTICFNEKNGMVANLAYGEAVGIEGFKGFDGCLPCDSGYLRWTVMRKCKKEAGRIESTPIGDIDLGREPTDDFSPIDDIISDTFRFEDPWFKVYFATDSVLISRQLRRRRYRQQYRQNPFAIGSI